MADNQQIIVEHIVNIDTTAENIGSVNAVAAMAVQVAALAGMLPDVAAAVTLRAELLAVSRNLGKVGRVSDALPMLEGLQSMVDNVTAVLGARAEIAAVVSQLHAITALAAELDTLLATPEHAASAQHSAEAAAAAIVETATNARDARTAQLNAEQAETSAKASAETAKGHEDASAKSAADAKQAADAAAAVSGLPDASAAAPGDPLIWTGTAFGMGGLDETLTSRSGAMGLSDATLADVAEIRATAEGVDAKATQAQTDASAAKTLAEGVDGKATQAAADAAEAKTTAAEASSTVSGFATRLGAAEAETGRVSVGLGQHTANGNIHTPLENVVAMITTAVNGAMDQIRDSGTGTLPEDVDTLKKLADLLADVDASLKGFLEGTDPDQRGGMIQAISEAQEGVTTLLANALTRMDVVNGLYSEEITLPLSAAQGAVLREQVEEVARSASVASNPWIKIVETAPSEWPYGFRSDGLLLVRPTPDGVAGADVKAAEWYIFDRTKPAKLVLTATQVRMSDGTTVQSAVGGAVAASAAAAADALAAKTLAEGVDAKATQAQTDAAEAKTLATGVDGKATQALETASAAGTLAVAAQTAAESAQSTAEQALAKAPDLATQTTPGIVKGSDTVEIGEDGSVNVVGGAGALVISPPAVTVPPTVAIGFPFDIGLVAGPVLLPGATVASFDVTVDGGAPISVPAVDGAATYSHTPGGEPGTILKISAVAVDSMGNRSKSGEAETECITALVLRPKLIAPSGIISRDNVTFITSAYTTSGLKNNSGDFHAASQYRLRTANDITVYDSGESTTDLLTHVATDPGLSPGTSYLADARHKSSFLGWSEWSESQNIEVPSSRHGERIDNKATLIGNPDGTPFTINGKKIWIAVLDAQYRPTGNRGWGPAEKPAAIASLEVPVPPNPQIKENMTEQDIDEIFVNEINSSKHNTDALAGLSASADICRQSIISGIPCDMPTIKVLSRIWQQRAFIDAHDPSALSNPSRSLSTWKFGTSYDSLWASSSQNRLYVQLQISSAIKRTGEFSPQPVQETGFGVLPILEIDA